MHILLQDIIDQTAQLGRDIRMLRYTIDSLNQEITYEICNLVALKAMLETVDESCAAPAPVTCEDDYRSLN